MFKLTPKRMAEIERFLLDQWSDKVSKMVARELLLGIKERDAALEKDIE